MEDKGNGSFLSSAFEQNIPMPIIKKPKVLVTSPKTELSSIKSNSKLPDE